MIWQAQPDVPLLHWAACSTCLSFMGQGEGAVKEAAWRVVLVMTQATAMEAVPDAALCGVPALTQLSTGDLQQLAGHLGWRCGGLADAVQAVALHGESGCLPSNSCSYWKADHR
jgi:hypothetical protein